jgi:hypothetical protein
MYRLANPTQQKFYNEFMYTWHDEIFNKNDFTEFIKQLTPNLLKHAKTIR